MMMRMTTMLPWMMMMLMKCAVCACDHNDVLYVVEYTVFLDLFSFLRTSHTISKKLTNTTKTLAFITMDVDFKLV